jgi:hypothetical protein
MNCRESEKNIYLYTELTTRERKVIDRHVRDCPACAHVFERTRSIHVILTHQRADIPQISHESVVTRRVMDAVHETRKEKPPLFATFLSRPIIQPIRYAMAALSLWLVAAFIHEYSMGGDAVTLLKQYRKVVPGRKLELNTAAFHDVFLTGREKKDRDASLLSECIVNCLHKQHADCSECAKFATRNLTP